MNRQLYDFYNHLQAAAVTTNNFADGVKYRKKDQLPHFAYRGLNTAYRYYLSLDLDYAGSARQFEVINIPPPTIVVTNRANGHCHYLYRLRTPVAYHDQARKSPQAFFEAVQQELTIQMKADRAFNHYLVKNPLSDRWLVETFPTAYHLSDFTEYFDLPSVAAAQAGGTDQVRGRNDRLFHTLRMGLRCCPRIRAAGELASSSVAESRIHKRSVWRSVAMAGSSRHRQRNSKLGVEAALRLWQCSPKKLTFTTEDAHQRMQAGAAYTNAMRVAKTKEQVLKGIRTALADPGATLTPVLIARQTGLNIKTVRNYFPEMLKIAGNLESQVGR